MMLAYESSGEGIPLVLIHAFPFCSSMWKAQIKFLAQKRKVITLDLPGFGLSAYESETSIAKMAQQVAQLLDSLKVTEPAMISGLSMGGYVALEFFRQFPERVRGLGLFSTRAGADTPEGRDKRLETADEIRRGGLETFRKSILSKLVGKTTLEGNPDLMREIKGLISTNNPKGVAASLNAMAERRDSTDLLAGIKCPTLIIAGDEDELIPFTESETMHRQIAGSSLHLIENVGHLVNLEQPAAFQNVFEKFLAKKL